MHISKKRTPFTPHNKVIYNNAFNNYSTASSNILEILKALSELKKNYTQLDVAIKMLYI